MEYFNKTLPEKKEKLLGRYYELSRYTIQIQKLIKNKKYVKAKNILCEMFVKIVDYKDTVDSLIIKDIKEFYKDFTENIKYPALFGKVSLRNEDMVNEEISLLVEKITQKVYELEHYLVKHPI